MLPFQTCALAPALAVMTLPEVLPLYRLEVMVLRCKQ
jgi:hypothetical protein